MATVDVSELTLEYKGKKALAKLSSWEQDQESVEIFFGKNGRWSLEVSAAGVLSLHDTKTPDCIDSMTVKELIELVNAPETPSPESVGTVGTSEPQSTSTAFN